MTTLPYPYYESFLEQVLEFVPKGFHITSLLGVSFYDGNRNLEDICPEPYAEVKILKGGKYYATLLGKKLIKDVSEEKAFECLLDELKKLKDSDM